jgi:pheromone shutdown protein TraB
MRGNLDRSRVAGVRPWVTVGLATVLLSCAPGRPAHETGRVAPSGKEACGVFVLGGIHQSHEGARRYTYERVGEVFRHLAPEVLCVEVLQRHLDDGSLAGMPFDFRKFMIPAARDLGVPVRGIDWWDEARGAGWQRLQEEAWRDPALAAPMRLLGELFGQLTAYFQEVDFEEIHGEAITRLWEARTDLKREVLSRSPAYRSILEFEDERNRQMLARVIEVRNEFPGRRLLVAVGIDHRPYLEEALRERGIRVLTVGEAMSEWWR